MGQPISPGQSRRWNPWPTRAWTAVTLLLTVLAFVAMVSEWRLNQPVLMLPVVMLAAGTSLWQQYGTKSPSPAAFLVDETRGEFAVPARLAFRANVAAWSLASLVMLLVTPFGFLRFFILGTAMSFGVVAVFGYQARGIRRLTPGGLLPGRGLSAAATPIPWEDIVGATAEASSPAIFGRRSAVVVGVTMVWPRQAKPKHFQWTALDVNARFLADAIEYYRTHPEHRAAIGTVKEHQRLYAALVLQYAERSLGSRPGAA